MTTLTLQEAVNQLYRIDDLYFSVYLEYCAATNKSPLGTIGHGAFKSVHAVQLYIEERYSEILRMRASIEELKNGKHGDIAASERIREISAELGLATEP